MPSAIFAISQSMTVWTATRATTILPHSAICSTIFTPAIPARKSAPSCGQRATPGNIFAAIRPMGIVKDPDDKKKWIVDEEAAEVVKRIFDLCVAGKGPMQIAKVLTADKVLTVKAYYAKRDGKPMPDNLYRWDYKSICGDFGTPGIYGLYGELQNLLQIPQTEKASAKRARKITVSFRNTQPAIIEEKVFERVQELRANKRRPAKKQERQGLFSGLALLRRLWRASCISATGKQL